MAKHSQRSMAKHSQMLEVSRRFAQDDPRWNEDLLLNTTKSTFYEFQQAWTDKNIEFFRDKLHPKLSLKWERKLTEMINRGETNEMTNVRIESIHLVDICHTGTSFTAYITARANDITRNSSGEIIKDQSGQFSEFWTYKWISNRWKLYKISQNNSPEGLSYLRELNPPMQVGNNETRVIPIEEENKEIEIIAPGKGSSGAPTKLSGSGFRSLNARKSQKSKKHAVKLAKRH